MSVPGSLPYHGDTIEWTCPHCGYCNHTTKGKGKATIGVGGAAAASGVMLLLAGPIGLLAGPAVAAGLALLQDESHPCVRCGKKSTLTLSRRPKPPPPRPLF